jgi:hypothetical protein
VTVPAAGTTESAVSPAFSAPAATETGAAEATKARATETRATKAAEAGPAEAGSAEESTTRHRCRSFLYRTIKLLDTTGSDDVKEIDGCLRESASRMSTCGA